jgi:PAS domain S-box-containing protein
MAAQLSQLVNQLQTKLNQREVALDAIAQGIVWIGEDRQIQGCNGAFERLVASDRPSIVGKTLKELLPLIQDDQPVTPENYPDAKILRDESEPTEYEFSQGDRACTLKIWGRWVGEAEKGRTIALIIEDITDIRERKRLAEELRQAQTFLQTLIDHLPLALFVKDGRTENFGRFQFWNKTCEQMFGLSAQQALGKTVHELFPPEQANFFEQKDRQTFEQQTSEDIAEEPIDTAHLGRRILHTLKIPLYDENHQPQYLLGICEDITERKRSEQARLESETRLRVLYESISLGIVTGDEDAVFDCNSAAEQLFRCDHQTLIGKHPSDLSPPVQPNGQAFLTS